MSECEICKKHYYQGGKCLGGRRNCLMFVEEPKGKVVRGTFCIDINPNAETCIVKPFSQLSITDHGKEIMITVLRINWINMEKGIFSIDADYHENEMPLCEKKKKFFNVLK